MNYEKIIVQGIDTQMKEFFKNIEERYKISKEELMDMWKGKTETVVQKTTQAPKDNKKSNYQKFFSIQRNLIMEEQPGISFGDISKQVSVLWKKMSADEKNRYTDVKPITDVSPDIQQIPQTQAPAKKTKSSIVASKTVITQKNDSNTIQIIHRDATTIPRRSDLEIHQEDKENDDDEENNDEEDFFFEEDDHNESYDGTIDDDDDMNDPNDTELFDDQDQE